MHSDRRSRDVAVRLVRLTKSKIRSKILRKLNIQKEEDRQQKSKLIKNKLFKSLIFQKAKTVMFYISLKGEVDTKDMIKEAYELGKIIAVPVCRQDKTLVPCRLLKGAKLRKGPYSVHQPAIKRCINLKNIDLVIVPGLAFTNKGKRLGRGKGYYDRFLANMPPKTTAVGLAYDFQILPFLPTTATDVDVDKTIFA